MRGGPFPHTDLKRGGSSPFYSSACLSFQIGAPATGREATNGSTSPHQSFLIRVTPFKLLPAPIWMSYNAEVSPYRPSERGRTQTLAASSSEALDSTSRVRLSPVAQTSSNPFIIPPSLITRDKLELMSSLAVFVGVLSISLQTPKESPPTVALCGIFFPPYLRDISVWAYFNPTTPVPSVSAAHYSQKRACHDRYNFPHKW